MAQSGSNSRSTGLSSQIYVLGWAGLGLIAAAYLTALYAGPQWVSASFWQPAGTAQVAAGPASLPKPEPAMARSQAAEEIAARFSGSDSETSGTKPASGDVDSAKSAKTGASEALDTAKSKIGDPIAAAGSAPAAKKPNEADAVARVARPDGVRLLVEVLPDGPARPGPVGSADQPKKVLSATKAGSKEKQTTAAKTRPRLTTPKVDAFGAGSRIETGSVASPAALAFGPALVRRTKTPDVGIHIASGPSLAALRLIWLQLTDRHEAALGGLKPRYTVSGGRSARRYRLMAGPLPTSNVAAGLCNELRRMNDSCAVAAFKGRRF